jgi:tRNA(His) guanylyltransferase
MTVRDSLGDRMKTNYENRTRAYLPRRTNTIIRLDGKAFHTYTRGRLRPWDPDLHYSLVSAAIELCKQAQGTMFGFVQSDEISLLLTDYATLSSEAWFDGNIQKITSVASSIVTAAFNSLEANYSDPFAYFDARVFTIPDPWEVHNYFVWRQKDIERNSLSMLAQANFPHSQLHGKRRQDLHDLLHTVGINWDAQPEAFKRGTLIERHDLGWASTPAPILTQESPILDFFGLDLSTPA